MVAAKITPGKIIFTRITSTGWPLEKKMGKWPLKISPLPVAAGVFLAAIFPGGYFSGHPVIAPDYIFVKPKNGIP